MVYKRFGISFSRLLLYKQDEIREIEATLNAMDQTDDNAESRSYLMSRTEDVQRDPESIPGWWRGSRPQLMQVLEKKILEYCLLPFVPERRQWC